MRQGPLVEMWRRRQRTKKSVTHRDGSRGGPVGTEATAKENMRQNREHFGYPEEGFVTPIEHTLLYSMLGEPDVYPEDVVLNHIEEEDFNNYLLVSESKKRTGRSFVSTKNGEQEQIISYGQLSAILALSAEKFPPSNDRTEQPSIPQKVCKCVMKCVVRYAEKHDLDRQTEVKELLTPVEKYSMARNNKEALHQILPFYVGYAASLITANPIPMLVGATIMGARGDKSEKERQNMVSITNETNKIADIETAGLLDEVDDF